MYRINPDQEAFKILLILSADFTLGQRKCNAQKLRGRGRA
jgi:hypothetical protein